MKKIFTLIIGIACVIIGIIILISHFNAQKKQSAETTAIVIRIDSEMETDSDGLDTRWYYPVVEYTVDGKKYENRLTNSGSTNSTEYKEGQKITIKYNPDNPDELSKEGDKGGLIGGIFFIVFGIIATIASAFGRF